MKNGSSPAELEQQAEQERARIAQTAEALRDRLTPGQLIDEMMDYFRHSDASAMLHNFKGQVRDNPLALAMVGAGMAWLMAGKGYPGGSRGSRPQHEDGLYNQSELFGQDGRSHALREGASPGRAGGPGMGASSASAQSSGKGSGLGDHLSDAADTLRDAGDRAASAVKSAAGGAGDMAHQARAGAREYAHSAGDGARRAVHDVRDEAQRLGQRSGEMFADLLEREPLIIGALGVAIGAAIGTTLPSTKVEDEYLGKASDRLKEGAAETFEKGVEKVKDVAGRVTEAAKDEADAQGLTPGDKPIARKVASVARAATDEAKDAVKEAKGSSASTSRTSSAASSPSSSLKGTPFKH
jgi:hypothetical protein